MKYRIIADSDLNVSRICLGTMTWGQQNSEQDAHEQLDYAVSQGVNFIDTAEMYPVPPDPSKQGRTETYLGNWLKLGSKRNDLIIASKITGPNSFVRTRSGEFCLDKKNMREAIEGSLGRLQTDYLDLYQVHWPQRSGNYFGVRGYETDKGIGAVSIEETLAALNELVQERKVRYIGVSNETPWGVTEYLRLAREKGYARIISIQNQYSLLNRTYEIGLSEFAFREKVELLAYSPLSMGVLSGKYLHGARPRGARFTLSERNGERYNHSGVQKAAEEYVELAKKHGLDPAQMALAFVNSRPFVAANIIGATSLAQLKSDIASIDLELSDEVLSGIEAIHQQFPDPTS